MNKEQGFILKPETYNQKEWYEVFMNLLKEYRQKCNIINKVREKINNLGTYELMSKKYISKDEVLKILELKEVGDKE